MKVFLVGGAVRDMLMGVPCKDEDFVVVGSTPEEMLANGFKQVGADFPVFLNSDGKEFALARKERKVGAGYNGFETDHSETVTLEEDLMRRDLTINAMAMDCDTGDIIDPFGGQKDIRAKMLRHVSPAFAEDPVRVLRLGRFFARFGETWRIHPETTELCKALVEAGELNHLTRERVLLELQKAMGEVYPMGFFQHLSQVRAFTLLFPEFSIGRLDEMLRWSNSCNARLNFALAVSTLHRDKVEPFFERLNIPNDWRAYARMFWHVVNFETGAVTWQVLEQIDAYRKQDLFFEVSNDVENIKNPTGLSTNYRVNFKKLREDFLVMRNVGFADLSPTLANTLKGPAIAKMISSMRRSTLGCKNFLV